VKRERIQQIVVGLLGLVFVALIYPLYTDLLHAKWLLQMHNECEPMFLSFYIALGAFLLLAVRKPAAHRSFIVFAGWVNLAHASVMAIQTIEAWSHGVHRDFSDVVIAAVFGGILLAVTPAKRQAEATVTG
jgi:membrane-bound acyltransferase YfiQ involved in biofilm formation